MSHFSPPPPPPPPSTNTPHIMLNDDYDDEEDSSDEEFSMSRSRGPSSVNLSSLTPGKRFEAPPPPPEDTSDDFMLSMDEIDRLQQQRKTTTQQGSGNDAFRSAFRQSFSHNSRPLLPSQLRNEDSHHTLPGLTGLTPPPPMPQSSTTSNITVSVPSAPIAPLPNQQNYGVMLKNELVPYKMPIDLHQYPTTLTHGGQTYPATLDTIPKSPFLAYQPQQGREFLNFQQVITNVDEAVRQARSGQYAVKRLVKFIEHWCTAELRHVDAQTSFVSTEAFKAGHSTYGVTPPPELLLQEKHFKLYCGYSSARSEQYDEMHRSQRAMIAVFNTIEKEISLRRKRIATSKRLVGDLATQANLQDHRIRKCYEDYKTFTAEKAKEISAVRKLEKDCQALLHKAKLSLGIDKEEEETSNQSRDNEKSKFKLFSTKLQHFKDKAKVQLAGGPQEICTQLAGMAEQYLAAIAKGNQAINHYQQRCNNLLATLALVEAERLVLFNFTLSQFAKTAFLTEQPIQLLYHGLLFSTFEMDPQYDFQEYLRRHRTSHGIPPQEPQEVYRLPVTPEDIRAMRLDVNPNSVFKVSLNQCMRIQQKDYPDLPTPRIMGVLVECIKKHNGLTAEGIFRISHQRDELIALRKQFESGNYDIPTTINSPHAPAALLKEWLRELQDSLIPTESYAMWMGAAKNIQIAGPGVANNHLPGSPALATNSAQQISKNTFSIDHTTEAQILNLYSVLDDHNQSVIREIATLCVEISHPLHQRVNRMTVENLAIVFAPSFFRNPSDDTQDILLNSKNETKMTALLLAAVGTKFFDCGDLDQAYSLLPPSQQLGGNSATGGSTFGGATPLSTPLSPSLPGLSPMGSASFFSSSAASTPPHYDNDGRQSGPASSINAGPHFSTGPSSSLFGSPIPEHSTPQQQFQPLFQPQPSLSIPPQPPLHPQHSHFGSTPPTLPPQTPTHLGHGPTPTTPQSSTAPPTPMSTNGSGSFFSSPNGGSGAPPSLPPRRGTFVLPQNQVLPTHPSQSRL